MSGLGERAGKGPLPVFGESEGREAALKGYGEGYDFSRCGFSLSMVWEAEVGVRGAGSSGGKGSVCGLLDLALLAMGNGHSGKASNNLCQRDRKLRECVSNVAFPTAACHRVTACRDEVVAFMCTVGVSRGRKTHQK